MIHDRVDTLGTYISWGNHTLTSATRQRFTLWTFQIQIVFKMSVLNERDIEIATPFNLRPRQKIRNDKKSNELTFFNNVRLMHKISRFYGFVPFSFLIKNGEISGARVGIFDLTWLIVCLTIYAHLIYTCPNESPTPFQLSPALVFEYSTQLISGLSRAMLIIILEFFNRHRIVKILIDLNQFDKQVSHQTVSFLCWNAS